MKKQLLILILLISSIGYSQKDFETIKNYIIENKLQLKISNNELADWVIVSETSSETTGITNYLVMQTYEGIKIENNYMYFWVKNGKIINNPEGFITNLSSKINTKNPSLNVLEGFSSGLTHLKEKTFSSSIIENNNNKYKLSNGNLADDPVSAELIYFPNDKGKLVLSWNYEFYSQNGNHLWKIKVDATNGDLLEKRDLVQRCSFGQKYNHQNCLVDHSSKEFNKAFYKENKSQSIVMTPGTTNYRVIPWNYESPNHSARQLITNPEATTALAPLAVAAAPNGWHNTNNTIGGSTVATTFNYTRGNNVFAKDDYDSNNTGGSYPTGTGTYPSLTFDYAYPGNGVVASTYINAAITNLFYMNNIMHDLWYQYGFNEANRNFQVANYGRGGSGNDAVNAEAQDGASLATPNMNNANFSTPGDGSAPRMQMYLWNYKKPSNLLVNTGTLSGTTYNVNDNAFNPGHVNLPVSPLSLTNDLVLYDDGTPDTSDACTAPINAAALNGKIAVIRRGTCTFAVKVKFAQDAGAIGVVVVNNVAGGISMAGADASITIPAVSMTQAEGEALIQAMSLGTVNISLSNPEIFVNADGDFDNGIIAHEYGHGISTRLVGGGAGLNSAEQPGEGWSDWLWLMMQIKPGDTRNDARGIATFAANQSTNGSGIREYRYSTDMNVNPHTFGDTNDQWYTDSTSGLDAINVHGLGSIWCVMLWDLAWDYIDKYGYSSNIYNGNGGNNKVMRLVIDAMKLTPANPTLIQCRNAIIQADQNTTGGQDYCMIWAAFARRGMGVNATSGSNLGVSGVQDQIEDFTEPVAGPNCTLTANYFENKDLINIYPNPSNGLLNISIGGYHGKLETKLYDLNGREVYSKQITDFVSEKSIDLNTLQSGVYILKIVGENLSHSEKIILN